VTLVQERTISVLRIKHRQLLIDPFAPSGAAGWRVEGDRVKEKEEEKGEESHK
jgi:hypothetical protein